MPFEANQDCLRRLRGMVKRGLKLHRTYRGLAAKTGISAATLQRIAKGKIVPSLVLVDQLARSLGETFWLGDPPE